MYLTRLDIHGIRNVGSASFAPIDGINILYGANGSGKTSILEAIYLLGRGRTFRSRYTTTLINHDVRECTVFGAAESKEQKAPYTIGVSREATGAFQFKVDGQRVSTSSSLADAIPLLLMNSDSFLLIEGSHQVEVRQLYRFHIAHLHMAIALYVNIKIQFDTDR